jgi:hypothetical protein
VVHVKDIKKSTINRVFIEKNAENVAIISLDIEHGTAVRTVGLYKMVYVSHIEVTKMETFTHLFAEYWGILLAFILGGAVGQGIRNLFKPEEPLPHEPVEHPEANTAPSYNPRSPYNDIS